MPRLVKAPPPLRVQRTPYVSRDVCCVSPCVRDATEHIVHGNGIELDYCRFHAWPFLPR